MALVEIQDLTIAFGGRAAVSDLSLKLEGGDRFGLIGESGSGKSLTALAIAGLLPETAQMSGSIRFDGSPLPADETAMARLRANLGHMVRIEIEVDTLDQLEEALTNKPDAILLDNMSLDDLRRAVALTAGRAVLEGSGNVTLESVRAIAETGVDYISSGALTHSAPNLDIGLDF